MSDDTEFTSIDEDIVASTKFSTMDFKNYLKTFHLSENSVNHILGLIRPRLSALVKLPDFDDEIKIFLTLRYYATGSVSLVAEEFRCTTSTAEHIINTVTREIALLKPKIITFPKNSSELRDVKAMFFSKTHLPKCIGVLESFHIRVKPKHLPDMYRNMAGFYSSKVQIICDSKLRFRSIVCGWPGSSLDEIIFQNGPIYRKFERHEMDECFLVAGEMFHLRTYLMTPFENSETFGEIRYNRALKKARNIAKELENVWKRRFPVLNCEMDVEDVENVVVATAVLHNIALVFGDDVPQKSETEEVVVPEMAAIRQPVEFCDCRNICESDLVISKFPLPFYSEPDDIGFNRKILVDYLERWMCL